MKIHSNFALKKTAKKSRKNWVWDPPGLHFEEFREALGGRLGALGRLFSVSCTLWGASRMPLGFHGCFGLDFGWVWGGSWWDFAKIWEGFCESSEGFGEDFDFLNWDPRAASLRPAERHNFLE